MSAICLLASETAAHAEDAPPPHVYAENTALVHINSGGQVVLQQSVDGAPWRDACLSPCDASLPTGALYRVSGPGTRQSKPFSLDEHDGKVALDVRRASTAAASWGIALMTVGVVATVVGLYLVGDGASRISERELSWCSKYLSTRCDSGMPRLVAGSISLGAGLGLAVVGAILVGTNQSTKVGQLPPADVARRPEWNVDRVAVPATPWVFPLVAITF